MTHDFRKLHVWQIAMKLCKEIYILTKDFPKEELFGIISQLRRASSSVPANIAEGSARSSNKDFAHFVAIAHGSINETITFLVLSEDLGFISVSHREKYVSEYEALANMITALRKSLK